MNHLDSIPVKKEEVKIIVTPRAFSASRHSVKEFLIEKGLFLFTILSSILIFFVFIFVAKEAWPVLRANGLAFVFTPGWDQDFYQAWVATAKEPSWHFGALPLICGTFFTTLGALCFTVPLGLGCAIFLVEVCPPWFFKPVESTVRLLSAIPSVIYGLVGLLVVVPWIDRHLITNEMSLRMAKVAALDGTSLLAGILVLGMMIVPIFVVLAADALRAVPKAYKEGSLALGISHWRTIIKVMLPVAKKGIIAGAILATGRAIGEAIALSMVSGSVANIPNPSHGPVFFLEPLRTLASTVVDNAEGMGVPTCESALFACGFFLLVSCVILSFFARLVARGQKQGGGLNGEK